MPQLLNLLPAFLTTWFSHLFRILIFGLNLSNFCVLISYLFSYGSLYISPSASLSLSDCHHSIHEFGILVCEFILSVIFLI